MPIHRWIGRALSHLRGGARRPEPAAHANAGECSTSPAPFVRRGWWYTALHFTTADAQSRMLTLFPGRLQVDYTRTMLGVLLFQPAPRCIGMIGLGGGSQAKFCHRHLRQARIEVVEIDPRVVALRRRFRVPDDDERLSVHIGDGAAFVRDRPGRFDLLLVDGYDATGISASLGGARFYRDCRAALAPGGAMAVNLYGPEGARHVADLRDVFGDNLLVVPEPRMSNHVALAWTGPGGRERALVSHGPLPLPRGLRRMLAAEFVRIRELLGPKGPGPVA